MQFINNKLIPTVLCAAAASVAIANPAQALMLTGGFDFDGFLTDLNVTDKDNFTIDFNESHDDTALIGQCTGSFADPGCTGDDTYRVDIADSLKVSGGVLTVNTNPFLSNIDTVNHGLVDFRLDDVDVFAAFNNGSAEATGFLLKGAFYNANGERTGRGVFTANAIGQDGAFAGSLEAIPTPAAVLPILTGIFGAASRKKEEQEA